MAFRTVLYFSLGRGKSKFIWKPHRAFVNARVLLSDKTEMNKFPIIEGTQGEIPVQREISVDKARKILEETFEYSVCGPGVQGVQGGGQDQLADVLCNGEKTEEFPDSHDDHADAYNCTRTVNLHGCMQTNVPDPYSGVTPQGVHVDQMEQSGPQYMPGGGNSQLHKYFSGAQMGVNFPSGGKREFHSSAVVANQSSDADAGTFEVRQQSPQGVQGDDCVQHKLWMENCLRYHLPNCDEQFKNLASGRKTLAQVFKEQDDMIREVAENYKSAQVFDEVEFQAPAPQGIQGDDCVRFSLWLENCNRFGTQKSCAEQLGRVHAGKKTLNQIFKEQEEMIRSAARSYVQRRSYSTVNKGSDPSPSGDPGKDPSLNKDTEVLTTKAKLKNAVAQYGSTVIVFHVCISLISLGGFYVLVDSGIDVVGLLVKLQIGEKFFANKLAAGTSTFVVAYAVHKLFAPVRIGITLTATPFIVGYLRRVGFLKTPKSVTSSVSSSAKSNSAKGATNSSTKNS